MKAGYLVGKWVEKKLKSQGQNAVVTFLAKSVGKTAAKTIVKKVVSMGAKAAATYIAGVIGSGSSLAGPIGTIVGLATGWA